MRRLQANGTTIAYARDLRVRRSRCDAVREPSVMPVVQGRRAAPRARGVGHDLEPSGPSAKETAARRSQCAPVRRRSSAGERGAVSAHARRHWLVAFGPAARTLSGNHAPIEGR